MKPSSQSLASYPLLKYHQAVLPFAIEAWKMCEKIVVISAWLLKTRQQLAIYAVLLKLCILSMNFFLKASDEFLGIHFTHQTCRRFSHAVHLTAFHMVPWTKMSR